MNKKKISKDSVKERKSKATYLNKVKANQKCLNKKGKFRGRELVT